MKNLEETVTELFDLFGELNVLNFSDDDIMNENLSNASLVANFLAAIEDAYIVWIDTDSTHAKLRENSEYHEIGAYSLGFFWSKDKL